MSYLKKPQATIFQHLTYDNYFLKLQRDDLNHVIGTLQSNISELNRFIVSHYDLSFNIKDNVKIIMFDSSDNVLSCIYSDTSGNFTGCSDLSMNYFPSLELSMKKLSKTHISDASRSFPYGGYPYYPHYPYGGYPYYPHYPYGGYPYYPLLAGDDYYYNRDIDTSLINKHPIPPNPTVPILPSPIISPPSMINHGLAGTHIHIYPHSKN
jgi:hypothetical protein